MSIAIPKRAKLVHQTRTQMVYVLGEHMWIRIRGDVIFTTIRNRDNHRMTIRGNKFMVKTNGSR